MRSPIGFCATTLVATGLLLMPAAFAQDKSPSAPSTTSPSPTTSPAAIPDNKLDAAAAAVRKVAVISDDFERKLAQAPADEKDRLLGEANAAVTKAVTDQGLSVDEYMTIMTVAKNDPEVRDKLMKRLQ
jgi:hypothetical protein